MDEGKVKRVPGGYEETFEFNGDIYATYTEDSSSNYKLKPPNFCRANISLEVLVAHLTRYSLRLLLDEEFA